MFRGLTGIRARSRRVCGVAFSFLVFFAAGPAQAQDFSAAGRAQAQDTSNVPVLTLGEAVRAAYDRNYDIRLARNDARIAANNYSFGNAGIFPTLTLNARQSRRSFGGFSSGSGQPVVSSGNAVDLTMNLSATLFDGLGQFATYRRLESEMEQVALGADRTTEAMLGEVVLGYYDLVRQQKQVRVLEEAVEISEQRLEIAELRRDLGSASELEVRRARVDLNADRAALLRQRISFATAQASFNELLAREGEFEFRVADTLHVDRNLRLEDLRSTAEQQNKTLAVARQAQVTSALARSEARSDWFPTVRLQAGYAMSDLTREIGLPATQPPGLSYGITASFDIFDGFNRNRRIENADLRLRNSELIIEDARVAVSNRLANAYRTYESSLELVDLERENASLASLNVEIALERFRQGTITSVELREVQSALTGAEGRFITAQFDAVRAQTELLQLSGALLDRLRLGG